MMGGEIKSAGEPALCITPGAVPPPQVLQIGRVKKIVKQGTDVKAVSNDANYAIARATVRPEPCTPGRSSAVNPMEHAGGACHGVK